MNCRKSLQGQVAIVTGAASGIGRAIARELARNGVQLALADRDLEGCRLAAEEIRSGGGVARPFRVDVSSSSDVDTMIGDVIGDMGSFEIFVHSAGIGAEQSFLDTTDEQWARMIDIDLSGSFYCMRAAGRHLSKMGYGRIIVLASTAGVRGGTGRAAYGAAKAGVISLTQVLAVELAMRNVTVNALAPGAIDTELVATMHSPATRINYRRSIPADRYGTPEEVAAAAVFLATPAASYVTGHVLAIDGGFLAAGVLNKPAAPLHDSGEHS